MSVGLAGRDGALLLGVGAAMALVRPLRYRIILAAPLAVFTAAIVAWLATGMLAVIYLAAVTVWWLQQVWRFVRAPGPSHSVFTGISRNHLDRLVAELAEPFRVAREGRLYRRRGGRDRRRWPGARTSPPVAASPRLIRMPSRGVRDDPLPRAPAG